MQPKVLIACPIHESKDYAMPEYLERIKGLTYPNFDVLFSDNSETDDYMKKIQKSGYKVIKCKTKGNSVKRIVDSRNMLRDEFLKGKYDYFFSLEQDVIPPKDVIELLLSKNIPIIAGLYLNYYKDNFGNVEIKPLAYMRVSKEEFEVLKNGKKFEGTEIRKKIESGKIKGPEDLNSQLSAEDVKGNKLIEVYFTGLGCMLIKREVLEKISFRSTEKSYDDAPFCKDAYNSGYSVLLDTSVKCNHLIKKKEDDWSKKDVS